MIHLFVNSPVAMMPIFAITVSGILARNVTAAQIGCSPRFVLQAGKLPTGTSSRISVEETVCSYHFRSVFSSSDSPVQAGENLEQVYAVGQLCPYISVPSHWKSVRFRPIWIGPSSSLVIPPHHFSGDGGDLYAHIIWGTSEPATNTKAGTW